VTERPYRTDLVTDFYAGAIAAIDEARSYGARTVYTSGDGEPTLFPRFFDLLEHLQGAGMEWLFFTAGLAFSSERAAIHTWMGARQHLRGPSRDRIESRLVGYFDDGRPNPTARALLAELAVYREHIQIYHSLWSIDPSVNTGLRGPLLGDYSYVEIDSRGRRLHLPSGLVAMIMEIFTDNLRGRLGIEMPVSEVSGRDLPAVAAFVLDYGLRSYFEPVIVTGRNRAGDLVGAPPAVLAASAPMLVRTLCGFRNIHQPTVKFLEARTGNVLAASPGMGVDAADLRSMGLLDPLVLDGKQGSLFRAIHNPLMAYAKYVHITGCKCNDFASEMSRDRANVASRWREISNLADLSGVTLDGLASRLRAL
jgi:hypothetical protein